MNLPVQTTYRNVEHSPKLEALILKEATKLERFYHRIVSCRVAIERARARAGSPYHVRIDLGLPGEELVISHEPNLRSSLIGDELNPAKSTEIDGERKNAEVAVREAFRKAERRLREFAERRAGL